MKGLALCGGGVPVASVPVPTGVIVQPKDYQRWLDPENEDVARILAPAPTEGWIAYPVNRRVNDPKNDDGKLIEPEPA